MCPLRVRGGFWGMEVIVIRTNGVGITPQHRLQYGENFFRAFVRTTIETPKLPRVQVHQALCIERCRIEIVWVMLGEFSHRDGILRVELPQIDLWIGRGALRESLNVFALSFP